MKKYLFLSVLCAMATLLPAQKKMYVWQGNSPTEFTVLEVDSVTFGDALPDKPEPEPLPECLEGVFSVAEGKTIKFSRGNLQYTQSTGVWAFAEQQYDFIGTDNVTGGEVSSDATSGDSKSGTALADKIDLFGWSGSTATAKWGIGTSTDNTDYSGDFVDWGQNIGDGDTWRTLTYDEWYYLRYSRSNADNLIGVAKIDLGDGTYANGLVLLPDNWQAPAGIAFTAGFSNTWSVAAYGEYQTFTLVQWQSLEEAGAVFLPASGSRYGTDVYYVGFNGSYWSASPNFENDARYLYFDSGEAGMYYNYRNYGRSVRLVQDTETIPEPEPEPLSGVFSVSADKQIQFAPGNLQYTFPAEDGGEGTWSFAEHQYDFLGTDNVTGGTVSSGIFGDSKSGDALADKIDLFGWSGSTGSAKWGISTSTDYNDYSGDFVDWGQNIGDGETWRTLTYDEWGYLLDTRENASGLKGVAKIDLGDGNYANGLILLPDNWQAPAGITFKSSFSDTYSVAAYGEYQTFTTTEWQQLESAGAVFLPASGSRSGSAVSLVGRYGYYWSATRGVGSYARRLYFYSGEAGMSNYSCGYGHSVRLVQDAE